MNPVHLILIIDAFLWILLYTLPLWIVTVTCSCWWRNRSHRQHHRQVQTAMLAQFDAFAATGQWPAPATPAARKAMKLLAQKMDLQDGFSGSLHTLS